MLIWLCAQTIIFIVMTDFENWMLFSVAKPELKTEENWIQEEGIITSGGIYES
jgi:hypothetical protein